MYYYVYESIGSNTDRKIQEKIKKLITSLGIVGEQVTPNPARTIDELIDIAITKGYSTIVAVGSDIFANKIASSILNQQKPDSQKIVFGFLPYNPETSILASSLNIATHEQAVQALRFRKLKDLSIAVLIPNKFFLIPLTIESPKPFDLTVKIPNLIAQSQATKITIKPDIQISWENPNAKPGLLKNFFKKIIQNEPIESPKSIFKTHSLDLKTDPALGVLLGSEVIARTPIRVKALPNYLHIIVNRASIDVDGKGEAKT
jgi:diacylglycerol kinase family enzyme